MSGLVGVAAAALACLGIAVGYGSAISGTGGPVMLIPILLALRTPVFEAIALGVISGLPITAAAWTLIGVVLWFGYASWRGGGVG